MIKEHTRPQSLREWVAMKLVRLAQKIYPESDAVKAFYLQLVQDQLIPGKTVVRVDPKLET